MIRLITSLVQIFLFVPAMIGLHWMYVDIKTEYKNLNAQLKKGE
jgi:hypothetical protein